MKKTLLLLTISMLWLHSSYSQELPADISKKELQAYKPKFGLKLGYSVAHMSGTSIHFSPGSKEGWNASVFYGPVSNGLGYRTELVFSRQGFSFDDAGNKQDVLQDYIYMPHLTTFTIAHRVQLQAGGQVGYLLNARHGSQTNTSGEEEQLTTYMNRVDYGAALGFELYPYKGLLIGARYNISMGNPYKKMAEGDGGTAAAPFPLPFNPTDFKDRNAVLHFFAGYRF